jgi:co-chaperonin GroES (HSP10)
VQIQPLQPFFIEVIMRPLHNKVLIERIAAEKVSSGGILLKSSDEPDRGKVLAVGPDADEVSIGDVILLNWNAAQKTGDNYIVPQDQIVLVFEEE